MRFLFVKIKGNFDTFLDGSKILLLIIDIIKSLRNFIRGMNRYKLFDVLVCIIRINWNVFNIFLNFKFSSSLQVFYNPKNQGKICFFKFSFLNGNRSLIKFKLFLNAFIKVGLNTFFGGITMYSTINSFFSLKIVNT